MVAYNSIYRNDGATLTAYGFACGYIERTNKAILFMEHRIYHVQVYKVNEPGYSQWESFESNKDARKFYNSVK